MPVAPRKGAWIETICAYAVVMRFSRVAPRKGAWIETSFDDYGNTWDASRLARARGLKHE